MAGLIASALPFSGALPLRPSTQGGLLAPVMGQVSTPVLPTATVPEPTDNGLAGSGTTLTRPIDPATAGATRRSGVVRPESRGRENGTGQTGAGNGTTAGTPSTPATGGGASAGTSMGSTTVPGSVSALPAFSNPQSAWRSNYNLLHQVDPRLAMNYAAKADTGNEFRRLLDAQYGDGGAQAFNAFYDPNSVLGKGNAYSRSALNGNVFTYIDDAGVKRSIDVTTGKPV